MSKGDTRQSGSEGTYLELDVWHPDCWTLETTGETGAELFTRGLYTVDDEVHARFTAHGDTDDAVQQLIETARESSFTNAVHEVDVQLGNQFVSMPGQVTTELLVMYPNERSIYQPFVSRGLVPSEGVEIRDGREYWRVVTDEDRTDIQRRLDQIRSTMDADVEVRRVISSGGDGSHNGGTEKLSGRQAKMLRLAVREGYYQWPRQVTAADLAADLDISKSTVLEHLRKAESKVFEAYDID
ncbi:MAG: helix-turn-helix domain-containing protein [Haloarculaceae archaeon]